MLRNHSGRATVVQYARYHCTRRLGGLPFVGRLLVSQPSSLREAPTVGAPTPKGANKGDSRTISPSWRSFGQGGSTKNRQGEGGGGYRPRRAPHQQAHC